MEDRNWSMYGPKIDMIELWPERTCGAQDTLNMMFAPRPLWKAI